jgi:uncharacterized RDD family membrane protein YckC
MSNNERIGFGTRLGSYVIDAVLAGVFGAIIGAVAGTAIAGIFFSNSGLSGDEAAAASALGGVIGGAIGTVAGSMLAYIIFLVMEGITGQTPGKMILKIQVKNEDGSKASTGTLMIRAALKNVYYVMALLAGVTGLAFLLLIGQLGALAIFVGCFFVLGEKKQSFHDMAAKTAVYKK